MPMPRLLRSLTRDPGGFDPSRVPPNTIFNETLIHDFDTLRYLNPGAEAVEVYATADALVEPDVDQDGLGDESQDPDGGGLGLGVGLALLLEGVGLVAVQRAGQLQTCSSTVCTIVSGAGNSS